MIREPQGQPVKLVVASHSPGLARVAVVKGNPNRPSILAQPLSGEPRQRMQLIAVTFHDIGRGPPQQLRQLSHRLPIERMAFVQHLDGQRCRRHRVLVEHVEP